jgi:hypothetical protein
MNFDKLVELVGCVDLPRVNEGDVSYFYLPSSAASHPIGYILMMVEAVRF